MEYENRYASKGVAGAGLGTGIAGLSLGVLNSLGGIGGLLLGNRSAMPMEGYMASHYELKQQSELAQKDSEIAQLRSEKYTDGVGQQVYRELRGLIAELTEKENERFTNVERRLAEEAVIQQKTEDSILMVNERIDCVKRSVMDALCRETDERKCADNAIVNYVNATFYPKMVADVTTGSTTTAQTTYNPLPIQCGCNGKR